MSVKREGRDGRDGGEGGGGAREARRWRRKWTRIWAFGWLMYLCGIANEESISHNGGNHTHSWGRLEVPCFFSPSTLHLLVYYTTKLAAYEHYTCIIRYVLQIVPLSHPQSAPLNQAAVWRDMFCLSSSELKWFAAKSHPSKDSRAHKYFMQCVHKKC